MTLTSEASVLPHTNPVFRALRLVFAVFGIVALAWIPLRNIDVAEFSISNYFSYFTVLSNVLGVVALLVGAIADPQSRGWQLFRGAATLYMVITGIIFAVLLSNIDVSMNDKWIDDTMHRYLPLVLLLDWVINPPRVRITDKQSVSWLWFPAVYGVYTLVRGPFVDWYPYPFIDPRTQGYLQMAIGLVVLLLAFVLMALAVNAAGRLARRWRYGNDEESA
ncbi:Pr6Pr family membrane protein [Rhodococcus sp. NPDC058514]|uniref:Pr6Pr family membrane protein n=1 Tax=unclassified Rhodococcus (in: high G+C Gram-positive bacteria) TaxID=192944 RepID=UPI0036478AC0